MEFEKFHTIVLASASPRRLELLRQIGIEPEVIVSHVEEVVTSSVPGEVVMELSRQKAEDVAKDQEPGTLVIGSDTVVAVDGRILGKPHDHDEAEAMIRSIEGRTHQVYTGVCMVLRGTDGEGDQSMNFFDETDVEVYPMSDEEIHDYAMSEEPMDKAGAYAVQGFFGRYIKGLRGSYANVMGLPISMVYQEMKKL
ncbi:MAG: septum formation protein Maf [Lachnospiraceae bacterium]|nr:septum formation protein Maf [Lachnospiraceae bacterium]